MAKITQWLGKLNAMTLRERLIIFIALLGAIIYAWYALFMHPLTEKKGLLQNQISEKQLQINRVEKSIEALQQGKTLNPRARKQSRIASLKFDIEKLNAHIKSTTGGMIDPTQMTKVLQRILTQKTNLSLVSLESLATKPLIDSGDKKRQPTENSTAQVYMHGVRLKFKGSYLDMLNYLKALERLPWRLFWGDINYDVKDYPEAYGTLDVYTLSLEEGWIGV